MERLYKYIEITDLKDMLKKSGEKYGEKIAYKIRQENGYKETQNLAVSKDGIHFEKYDGNPVIKKPPVDTTLRFRDPKIW